ncbi:MAG: prepilin-type N-terminal cleavage/methylation domain-containing protein [Candidatus Gastranaerophilales bacterium]|nr:prepilin-type N-terminal cleavage/methylation domain-containing protein [Candidatus Gastranaerophilales bacterium]
MKKRGLSLIEIIMSTTILGVVMIMIGGVITKKVNVAADISSGTFACYKDVNGNLNQKVTLLDGTVQHRKNIQQCNFTFPSGVSNYKVAVIGGGGGGGKISEEKTDYWVSDAPVSFSYNLLRAGNSSISQPGNNYTACLANSAQYSPLEYSNNTTKFYLNSCPTYKCDNAYRYFMIPSNVASVFESSALEKIALNNRSFFVRGGKSSEINGATCAFRTNFRLGDNFKLFNGFNEKDCPEASTSPLVSAGPGVFLRGADYVLAQGARFSDTNISIAGKDRTVSDSPVCHSGGNITNKKAISVVTLTERDKVSYTKTLPRPRSSHGGKAGTTVENNTLNLSGRTVLISKSDIGDGGKPGLKGQNTNFKDFNLTAWGGDPGANMITYTGVALNRIPSSHLVQSENYYTLSNVRLTNATQSWIPTDGEMSNYVKNTVLNGVAQQNLYKGLGAHCDSAGVCTKSTSPNEESFGSGGGGGNSLVKYDPFYKISYERPDYINNTYETVLNSTVEPIVEIYNGSSGMGGAVVISW